MSDDDELTGVRRSVKSESAFRTISEVADDLDVPQHVLRFWESKFPQVKPLKRGGGRRYYRPEDIALLRRIRDLLYSEGYTIKGVQKLLREGGAKELPIRGELELALPLPQGQGAAASFPLTDDEDDETEIEVDDQPSPVLTVSDLDEEKFSDSAELSAVARQELAQILEELEQLRSLLQPR